MRFKTAILYDIENLIGGYGQSDYLSNLSLKDIYEEIIKIEFTEGIAIQRAYANWSNHRLNILRGDITELGIEPVQMFGFGKGSQKNASDIQLAIDAIDIAFTRPVIETFVIVSGDGGFSALAKKLHEYGKMVIGCAYRKATNKVFEAVCDSFIWIDEPKDEFEDVAVTNTTQSNEPILKVFANKFKSMDGSDMDVVFKQSREILNFFANYKDSQYLMRTSGMNISIIHQALNLRMNDFNYLKCGFAKFVDFLRFTTNGTKTKLVFNPPSEYRIVLNDTKIAGFNDVEPILSIGDIHTAENYEKLLSVGSPRFVLFSKEATVRISQFLANNFDEIQNISYGDIIEKLTEEFEYEQKILKQTISSLIGADCFGRSPEDQKLSEQSLTLKYSSIEEILEKLKIRMFEKLEQLLGEVDSDQFAKIIE